MDKPNTPRGLRNNNPLNIIRSAQVFLGESKYNTDPKFKKFVSVVMGYRAAFCIIRTYVLLKNCKTLSQVISRWCPEPEVLSSYIDFVSARSGVLAAQSIDLHNAEQMTAVVAAMSHFENGVEPNRYDILKAYKKVFP